MVERSGYSYESKFFVWFSKIEKEENPEFVSRDMCSDHGGAIGECPCADKRIRYNI